MLMPPGKNPQNWAARAGQMFSALSVVEGMYNHPLMPQMAPLIEAALPAMRSILAEGPCNDAFYAFYYANEERPDFEEMGPDNTPEEGDPVFGPLWANLVEGEGLLRLVTNESHKIDPVHVMWTPPVPHDTPDLIAAWAALAPKGEL